MAFGDLVVTLGLNAAPFASGLAAANNRLNSFSAGVTRSLGAIRGALGVLGPIGAGIGAAMGFSSMISGARDAAAQQNKLEAVLKATGGAAGLTSGEIATMADSLASMTNFEDDATIGAAGVLATFKEIKGDTFKSAIGAAQDLSAVMGQDLQSSVVQIGKALNDPTKGFAALRRVGVSFTESQIQQIKTLQQSGDMLGAQGVILGELQSEFGGAAQAMADPFIILQNNVGNAAETLGAAFLPVLNEGAGTLSGLLQVVTDNDAQFRELGASILQAFSDGQETVSGFLVWMTGGVGDTTDFVGQSISGIAFVFRNASSLSQIAIVDLIMFTEQQVPGIGSVFVGVAATAVGSFSGIMAFGKSLVQNVVAGFQEIGNAAKAIFDGIAAAFQAIWNGENPLTAFQDKMTATFAAQQDVQTGGNPFEKFQESFKQSFGDTKANLTGIGSALPGVKADLLNQINNSEAQFQLGLSAPQIKPPTLQAPEAAGGGGAAKSVKVEGLQAGSKEAYMAIQSFLNGGRDDTAKTQLAEQIKQTREAERSADSLDELLQMARDNRDGYGDAGGLL